MKVYSGDLVKSGAAWGKPQASSHGGDGKGWSTSKEWDRIAPASLKLNMSPRYSDGYKKRMGLGGSVEPDMMISSTSPPSTSSTSSTSTFSTYSTAPSAGGDYFHTPPTPKGAGFRSLTDLKWGEFESMGFGGLGTEGEHDRKLQFDLTEGARNVK